MAQLQTLNGFMIAPFNNINTKRDETYDSKYRSYLLSNKIKVFQCAEIEDSYYIHVKVPSESQKDGNVEYDVVIRFFTDKADVAIRDNLKSYYVQFFSNSPSFMYQYAYLYNKEGFLIEALYNKTDTDYINTPPEKTNKNMNLSYDKSIYFACRFLLDKEKDYLSKSAYGFRRKKVDSRKFFRNISDFKATKFTQSVLNEEKKLSSKLKPQVAKEKRDDGKKKASTSTNQRGTKITSIKRIKAGGKIGKKTASKTTRKR